MESTEPIRILVFGETGTGKTSMCTSLSGEVMPTSGSAIGVTFKSFCYPLFLHKENGYLITDTIGLNEGDNGTVKATEALKNLIELVKKSENGYNLLIHVAKGRITKSWIDNYKFFYELICEKNIPIILVVTGCELSEPLSLWEEENKIHFENDIFDYKAICATCFANHTNPVIKLFYDKLREESVSKVMLNINKHALLQSKKLYNPNKLGVFLKRLWNGICDIFEVPSWKAKINESLFNLLKKMGFSDNEADDIAYNWGRKNKK